MSDAVFMTSRGQAADVVQHVARALVAAVPKATLNSCKCDTNLKQGHWTTSAGTVETVLGPLIGDPPAELRALTFLHVRKLNVQLAGLTADKTAAAQVTYAEGDGDLTAKITLHATEGWRSDELERVVTHLSSEFTFRRHDALAIEGSSKASREVLQGYENALSILGTNVSQLGLFLVEQQKSLDAFLKNKLDALDGRYAEKEKALEDEVATERRLLAEKEARLVQREEAIDARDRTTTRRELLKKIREILEQQKDVQLSPATTSKRSTITVTCVLVMLASAVLAGRAAWMITERGLAWSHGVPMSAGLLLFASTLVFFLRWNDAWFADHARAEFQTMRNHADILRASWVAELYFEWTESKDTEFPPVLAERLTQNLFAERGDRAVQHPIDQVLNALKKIHLRAGDLELNPAKQK